MRKTQIIPYKESDFKETNGDRIRQMTDEELAEFLHKLQAKVPLYGYERQDAMFEWLKQEATENDER